MAIDSRREALLAKIHPQLPLNPQESDKLVRMLRGSFRKQLDEAHPTSSSKTGHPISDHLHPVLSNPLFSGNSLAETEEYNRTDAYQVDKSPAMEQFRVAVAAGTADLNLAQHSLSIENKRLGNLAERRGLDIFVLMKSSTAGSLVRSWLWSSGQEDSLDFLRSKQFIRTLFPFLIAEGQGTVPLQWLKSLSSRNTQTRSKDPILDLPKTEARILCELVYFHLQCGSGTEAALRVFLDYLEHKKLYISYLDKDKFSILRPTGARLVRTLAKEKNPTIQNMSTYDAFHHTVDLWARQPWDSQMFKASLLLYHPINPDESLAWHYVQHLALYGVDGLLPLERRDTITLLLDATETLLSKGLLVRAVWLATFLQTNFADELSIEESTPLQVPLIEEDTSHIKSLEALVSH